MGHVRDLPKSKLGVEVEKGFEASYEIPEDKKTVIKNLQAALNESDSLWLATDEDREGEAIGWHLTEVLKRKKKQPIKRIVFHEITDSAIKEAIQHPRELDENLISAQQARRVLDRLVGYTLSPFLWKKVYRGLSAGRVQSVAVRLIVDREREIRAFKSVEYWTIEADFLTKKDESFVAGLRARNGKKFVPGNQDEADKVLQDLRDASYAVSNTEEKELKKNPPPPFTTSTLQQEAGRKLGFSVKQTMVVAQQLYEGIDLGKGVGQVGLITYMRTDSVNLSEKALEDTKRTIEANFGREYVLSTPRKYKTKSKGAQEAHEAIRPSELDRTPVSLKDVLDTQQLKLYTLIWNRTMATQMPSAELKRVGVDITAGIYTFRATGQTITFDGYLRVYSEGHDEPEKESEEVESDDQKLLPPLKNGDALDCDKLRPEQHFTKPPPRYTEASLVKKLEEEGIGRPSTYAPTISTIQQRGYIRKEGKQLAPEEVAFTVTDLLAEHFKDIVDLTFTAQMEEKLDEIAEGKADRHKFLAAFYAPFNILVLSKTESIKREDIRKEVVLGKDPASGLDIIAMAGRFGPYVQVGRKEDYDEKHKPRSASLPKGVTTETATLKDALAQLSFPKEVGSVGGESVVVSLGRFGPYIKYGTQNASIPPDINPADVTFEDAKRLLSEAKEKKKKQETPLKVLGTDPTSKGEIQIREGRYGPYVTDGTTNASISKSVDPLSVDIISAAQMLDKKRNSPKRAWKGKSSWHKK